MFCTTSEPIVDIKCIYRVWRTDPAIAWCRHHLDQVRRFGDAYIAVTDEGVVATGPTYADCERQVVGADLIGCIIVHTDMFV